MAQFRVEFILDEASGKYLAELYNPDNQQEVLRKVFFRVVRFCDKENGKLPETFAEVISSQGMKDIIERLTMANWSDPSDFKPFLSELTAMKKAFDVRTTVSAEYFKAVLDQVEGRN